LGGASPATDAQFIEGELHQWLGSWVAGGTDLHGDGYADVAVGALGAPPMIIPGGPEGADVDGLLTVGSGSATTDWPGGVHAPDVNGDGLDELVLSTHEQASGADHLLFVLGGVDREVAEQPAGSGPCNGYGCLGFSMDAADLDGDGLGDVVAGHVDNSSVRIQYSRCVDADLDGYCDDEDCDDTNPDIHPEAVDWCDDFIDSDCDGVGEVDEHPLCDTNACAGCSSSSVRWSILAVLAVALRRRRYSGAQ
jgi:hypothetical protein